MARNIFCFELEGKQVLGFDTGLDAQAFAQAKMAQFITQTGLLVFPNGKTQAWKPESVYEKPGENGSTATMVVWGPSFPGVSLDSIIRASINADAEAGPEAENSEKKNLALEAVRYWLKAQEHLKDDAAFYPGASGIFINMSDTDPEFPVGTILFPPERLTKRIIEAGGSDEVLQAQQWIHPDLRGKDSISFCAGAMAYTIFTGALPFVSEQTVKNDDVLRQDIREGVFIPLRFVAPGLDKELIQAVSAALEPIKPKAEIKTRPAPEILKKILGDPGSGNVSSWFTPLGEEEKIKISNELEQYRKKRDFTVKTRRFVIRNTTIIVICLAALIGAGLMVRGYFQRQAERPNTLGMTPVEVVNTYYGTFETLDHELMDACIYGKNAKLDLEMIINLFVISRNRMAYEGPNVQLSPQQWLDAGSPPTNLDIFGVTDLTLRPLGGSESTDEISLEARYRLWMPAAFFDDYVVPSNEEMFSEDYVAPPPISISYIDRITLSLIKGAWRITAIDRTMVR